MAIVKASWTLSIEGAKASLRYYMHRRDQEGKRSSRTLFGPDGPLTRLQGYQVIDKLANGKPIYRLIISPDPRREDNGRRLNLRDLTERTMLGLSALTKKYGLQFMAVEHTDHSQHRHIHLITFPGRFLRRADLKKLRDAASDFSRSLQIEQGQHSSSIKQVYRLQRALQPVDKWQLPRAQTERTIANFGSLARLAPTCPNCGPWITMERKGRFFQCRQCGLAVSAAQSFKAELRRSSGLALSREVGLV